MINTATQEIFFIVSSLTDSYAPCPSVQLLDQHSLERLSFIRAGINTPKEITMHKPDFLICRAISFGPPF
jgi:hypothetical protein